MFLGIVAFLGVFIAPIIVAKKMKGKPKRVRMALLSSLVCFIVFVVSAINSSPSTPTATTPATTTETPAPAPEPVKKLTPEEQAAVDAKVKEAEAKAKADAEKADFDKWVKDQFSAWDGSHITLVKLVKENMNDPKSFEHDTTTYVEDGDMKGITVKMVFRGKNAFGGVIKNTVIAHVDRATNKVTVISQE